jgi:anti-sigma regulatory factor (Ser/Thr protein kinase)
MRPITDLHLLTETQLPPTLSAPSLARAQIRGLGTRLPPSMVDDVLLLANELVTNALRHGPAGRPILLRILGGTRLRIEVGDAGRWHAPPVHMPEPDLGATDGWGLPIVDALADGWGVTTSPDSTVAWAEVVA